MNPTSWRRVAAVLLIGASVLTSSCESTSGVGFSVGLPANYGSMELGLATTNWVGSPFW